MHGRYGDTQTTLPKFLQGRVKGATYGDETSRTTVTVKATTKKKRLDHQVGGKVLPMGGAEKKMRDKSKVAQVDKKGRRYHTGNPSRDKRAAKREAAFKSKYGKRVRGGSALCVCVCVSALICPHPPLLVVCGNSPPRIQ